MPPPRASPGRLSADASAELQARLARSRFRGRFRLNARDAANAADRGTASLRLHARDFVERRLAPAEPADDGRQTPMCGHPVFVAQHATATCCRSCLARWHGIPAGRALDAGEVEYVLYVRRHGCATCPPERPVIAALDADRAATRIGRNGISCRRTAQ